MSKHDEARRAFLVGAAVTGAAAGAALAPEAYAKEERQKSKKNAPEHKHASDAGFGAFFNSNDAATIAAFTERLMPGAPGKPGARDANVLVFTPADMQSREAFRRGPIIGLQGQAKGLAGKS